MASEALVIQNAAPSHATFVRSLGKLSEQVSVPVIDREIGCIILNDPVFFRESDWIDAPDDWPTNTVQGKVYSTGTEVGARLWQGVLERLNAIATDLAAPIVREAIAAYGPTYGSPVLVKQRLGQGLFRVMTIENYGGRCCITGETTTPVIEAAHILPVSRGGEHRLGNGLALRADMHILFDRGLLSVDPDFRIRVSPRIRDLYHNGIAYYRHELEPVRSLPGNPDFRPDRELLDWHFREVYAA
jgi:putative restriction endonuclease